MKGYDVEVLKQIIEDYKKKGLKSVHNDMCYPAPSCNRTIY